MKSVVLKENNSRVRKVLSHKGLNKKRNEQGKQEWSDIAELARTNAKLKKNLEAAVEKIARLGADV